MARRRALNGRFPIVQPTSAVASGAAAVRRIQSFPHRYTSAESGPSWARETLIPHAVAIQEAALEYPDLGNTMVSGRISP